MKHIAAAFSLFTRIPVWKWVEIPSDLYSDAVIYWPLTGWVTGGMTALMLWLVGHIMPLLPAMIIALSFRALLTGALHEDGLADFFDGFGGGHSKDKILSIMKDSHIGTYGVISLIIYYVLFVSLISSLSLTIAVVSIFAADVFAKTCAAQLTNLLPYARPEGAKNRVKYSRMTAAQIMLTVLSGLLPLGVLAYADRFLIISIAVPIIVVYFLTLYMRRKIGGYTGDCCGATCLLCEISMITGIVIIYNAADTYTPYVR